MQQKPLQRVLEQSAQTNNSLWSPIFLSMWNPFRKENKPDSVFEVIELMQTVNNRKLKHLHDCVKGICATVKIDYSPPSSFITEYEQKVLERFAGPRAEELKKLVNSFYDEPETTEK